MATRTIQPSAFHGKCPRAALELDYLTGEVSLHAKRAEGEMRVAMGCVLALAAGPLAAKPPPDARLQPFLASVISDLDAGLKDYSSARFQRVKVAFTPTGRSLVCGMVNAKNSYGAFEGWRYFWEERGPGAAAALRMSDSDGCTDYDVVWLDEDFSGAVAFKAR